MNFSSMLAWLSVVGCVLVFCSQSKAQTITTQTRTAQAEASISNNQPWLWTDLPNTNVLDSDPVQALITGGQAWTHDLEVSDFGFNLPPSATVVGIEVTIRRDLSVRVRRESVRMRSNGYNVGNFLTGNRIETHGYESVTYGGSLQVWNTQIGPSKINSSDFGMRIRYQSRNVSSTPILVDYVTVSVTYSTPACDLVVTPTNATVCPNTPVYLNVSGATAYQWSPATGLSCTSCPNPIATVPSTTQYTVTGLVEVNGTDAVCGTANVTVTVSPEGCFFPCTLAVEPAAIQVCPGIPFQAVASGANSYLWEPAAGTDDNTIANPVIAVDEDQTYTVTGYDINNNVCDQATVAVTVLTTGCDPGPFGLHFNNYGVNVVVQPESDLRVQGNIFNEKDGNGNGGIFNNEGEIRLTRDWTNNGGNDAFSDTEDGTVELFGAVQRIRGTDPTQFYNLTLHGTGPKQLEVDARADGVTALTDLVLATGPYTYYVNTTAATAIERNEGMVTSGLGGFLQRDMATAEDFLFPVGSTDGTVRYREVLVRPSTTSSQTYRVRMVNNDPTNDSYDRAVLANNIQVINDLFYHVVEPTSATADPADLTVAYDPLTDGDFQNLAHWDAASLSPTPILPAGTVPIWNNMGAAITTYQNPGNAVGPNGLPLHNAVSVADWTDYTNPIFALSKAGMIINTATFGTGNGGNDEPVDVTFVVNGPGLPTTPTPPFAGGTGNTDGTGGSPVIPQSGPVAGCYTIDVLAGNLNTAVTISYYMDAAGNISDVGVGPDCSTNLPLASDLYDLPGSSTLVLNGTPAANGPDCSNNISINFAPFATDPVVDPLLFDLPNDRFHVIGIDSSDPNLQLSITDQTGAVVQQLTGAAVVTSPWAGTNQSNSLVSPGVYGFELVLSVNGGTTHTFKGQFFVQ